MATPDHVRNPLEWGWQTIKRANVAAQSVANSVLGAENGQFLSPPVVRRIGDHGSQGRFDGRVR